MTANQNPWSALRRKTSASYLRELALLVNLKRERLERDAQLTHLRELMQQVKDRCQNKTLQKSLAMTLRSQYLFRISEVISKENQNLNAIDQKIQIQTAKLNQIEKKKDKYSKLELKYEEKIHKQREKSNQALLEQTALEIWLR